MINIFTNQRVNGESATVAFAGGVATVNVELHASIGTELVTILGRPQGSTVSFKTLAQVSAGRTNQPINLEVKGPYDLKGLLTGADPNPASPATSKTNVSCDLGN